MAIPLEGRFWRQNVNKQLKELIKNQQPKPWVYKPEANDDNLRMQKFRREVSRRVKK